MPKPKNQKNPKNPKSNEQTKPTQKPKKLNMGFSHFFFVHIDGEEPSMKVFILHLFLMFQKLLHGWEIMAGYEKFQPLFLLWQKNSFWPIQIKYVGQQ